MILLQSKVLLAMYRMKFILVYQCVQYSVSCAKSVIKQENFCSNYLHQEANGPLEL